MQKAIKESPAQLMFRYLTEHPTLQPANYIGDPIAKPPDRRGIGILFNDPATMNRSRFKRFLMGNPHPDFLGVLYFYSKSGLGDWTFHVLDRKFRMKAMLIANDLREKFGLDVRITETPNN